MLYDRIIRGGTINEPKRKSGSQFVLPSTVNWMRALSILLQDSDFGFQSAIEFYGPRVAKTKMDHIVENSVFEQLFLALHYLSALERLKELNSPADFGRIGILGWYYGIIGGASAMIAAQDGSFQETHAGTAKVWDSILASKGLVPEPFGWRVSSLVQKTYKPEVAAIKDGSKGVLKRKATTPSEAVGAAAEYLSGSAKWYMEIETGRVRQSNDFKVLEVDGFLTKDAQKVRDHRLSRKSVCFLHQAIRYRGKANYRDALFLAYGAGTEAVLKEFLEDQVVVLRAFLSMAGAFAAKHLGAELWREFLTDVEAKRAFSTCPSSVWE